MAHQHYIIGLPLDKAISETARITVFGCHKDGETLAASLKIPERSLPAGVESILDQLVRLPDSG